MVTAQIYFPNRDAYLQSWGKWRATRRAGEGISQKDFYQYMRKRERQGGFERKDKAERPVGHVENDVIIIHENHVHLWPNPHYDVRRRPFPETEVYRFERRWSRLPHPNIPNPHPNIAVPPAAPQPPAAQPA